MSPRDTLKRITSSFGHEPKAGGVPPASSELGEAHLRLKAIMAEVSAIPVQSFVPRARTQPSRDPSAALRWLVVADSAALALGFVMAWGVFFLFHAVGGQSPLGLTEEAGYFSFVQYGLVSAGVVAWFWHQGHYRKRIPLWLEIQKVVNAFAFALLLNGFLQFAMKQDFSRLWMLGSCVFGAMGVLALRAFARTALRRRRLWQVRTLLVGTGAVADETLAALRSEPEMGYEITTQIEDVDSYLREVGGSWGKLCDHFNANYVIIALDGLSLAQADSAIASLVQSGIPFSVSPPVRHLPVLGMTPIYFFSRDVILMSPANNLEQPLSRLLKRSMDIVCSGLGLLVLSPILFAIASMVKRDGGPAFFGDIRIGRNGKAFACLKFRSMVLNSDAILKKHLDANAEIKKEWDIYRKLRGVDPRVTKVGAFIRRWSIDELPQLINVFRGDMSLVGPRPIMVGERVAYSRDMANYCRVRPGLTGLWQVSGRNNVSFDRRGQMDSWYVRNWSLSHDLAILFKTIPVILKKTGAF